LPPTTSGLETEHVYSGRSIQVSQEVNERQKQQMIESGCIITMGLAATLTNYKTYIAIMCRISWYSCRHCHITQHYL